MCVLVFQRGRTVSRIAHCNCGSLRVKTMGEPTAVVACHCLECQRRTGAPFGVGVYSRRPRFEPEASKVYIREVQEGRKVRFRFCPECGTTVYWDLDRRPTILASLSVHSPILLFLRRRDRSGRNLGIRGSPSGIISGISRKRHQSPEPLADLGRQQHRAIVGSGRLSPQRTTASG
jgi:hypothetical protein